MSRRKKNKASLKYKSPSQYSVPLVLFMLYYFKSDTSLRRKFMTVEVKTKLENTVNSPAIPVKYKFSVHMPC